MKTTAKDFALFKKECEKWIDFFGLTNWRVVYCREQYEEDAHAWFSTNSEGMVATIALCPDWKHEEVTTEQIKKSAFHEVCEMMFSHLQDLAQSRYWDPVEYQTERHAIIRRLENSVFKALG